MPANAGDERDVGLITRSGVKGNPLQYSYLENSVDRGAWWTIVHGVAKNHTLLSG